MQIESFLSVVELECTFFFHFYKSRIIILLFYSINKISQRSQKLLEIDYKVRGERRGQWRRMIMPSTPEQLAWEAC